MAKASDDVPADIQEGFKSGAWKERLEAAEKMTAWIESGEGLTLDSEVLFRFLGTSPGWGEKNFQVSTKTYNVMALLAQKSPTFGKSSAAQAIGPLTDKLGDLKLKKPASEALIVFAEKTSLGFVLSQGEPVVGLAQRERHAHQGKQSATSLRLDDQTEGTKGSSGRVNLGQAGHH